MTNVKQDPAYIYLNGKKSQPKVTRYKWRDPGVKGEMMMVNKNELKIPVESYQREERNEKATGIASIFDWQAFGVLIVNQRSNGDLHVTEGGHRLRAAMLRYDIEEVPCIVFKSKTLQNEAESFITINTKKSNISAFDMHKAGLVAKDPICLAAENLMDKIGYKISKDAKTKHGISAIGTLKIILKKNQEIAAEVMELLAEMAKGQPITSQLMRGFFLLVEKGLDIHNNSIRKKITSLDVDIVMAAAYREKAILGKGGERVEAKAILDLINKNRKKKINIGIYAT